MGCPAVALAAAILFAGPTVTAQQVVSTNPPPGNPEQQGSGLLPHPFVYAGARLVGGAMPR